MKNCLRTAPARMSAVLPCGQGPASADVAVLISTVNPLGMLP